MPQERPPYKPANPCFSSGPCAKRPGWTLDALARSFLGRSHRASEGKARLKSVIDAHRRILNIPNDYRVAIVPASDTGAIEMALWSMLGERPCDIFAWESFGKDWVKDIRDQLKLPSLRVFETDYGHLPDLGQANAAHDIVFTWNGTTSGVAVPDADWISDDRQGLTFCDATSAVFACAMPWQKLDVTTWSWQKVIGGEAAHGMLVLSPRAVARLETYTPAWGLPKLFRMTNKGKLNEGLFQGETINTPSMLAVEDCLDALLWVEKIGGVDATITRSRKNANLIYAWAEGKDWIAPLAHDPITRSVTSVCLAFTAPEITSLSDDAQKDFAKKISSLLEKEGAAYDINHYRDAPAGLRVWCGATVEATDIDTLLPWIEWAYETVLAQQGASKAA